MFGGKHTNYVFSPAGINDFHVNMRSKIITNEKFLSWVILHGREEDSVKPPLEDKHVKSARLGTRVSSSWRLTFTPVIEIHCFVDYIWWNEFASCGTTNHYGDTGLGAIVPDVLCVHTFLLS